MVGAPTRHEAQGLGGFSDRGLPPGFVAIHSKGEPLIVVEANGDCFERGPPGHGIIRSADCVPTELEPQPDLIEIEPKYNATTCANGIVAIV